MTPTNKVDDHGNPHWVMGQDPASSPTGQRTEVSTPASAAPPTFPEERNALSRAVAEIADAAGLSIKDDGLPWTSDGLRLVVVRTKAQMARRARERLPEEETPEKDRALEEAARTIARLEGDLEKARVRYEEASYEIEAMTEACRTWDRWLEDIASAFGFDRVVGKAPADVRDDLIGLGRAIGAPRVVRPDSSPDASAEAKLRRLAVDAGVEVEGRDLDGVFVDLRGDLDRARAEAAPRESLLASWESHARRLVEQVGIEIVPPTEKLEDVEIVPTVLERIRLALAVASPEPPADPFPPREWLLKVARLMVRDDRMNACYVPARMVFSKPRDGLRDQIDALLGDLADGTVNERRGLPELVCRLAYLGAEVGFPEMASLPAPPTAAAPFRGPVAGAVEMPASLEALSRGIMDAVARLGGKSVGGDDGTA